MLHILKYVKMLHIFFVSPIYVTLYLAEFLTGINTSNEYAAKPFTKPENAKLAGCEQKLGKYFRVKNQQDFFIQKVEVIL